MSEPIVVGISDYKWGHGPDVLVTHALGSCVGICLYDSRARIGGLAHIMLPDSSMFAAQSINRMKFADTAVADLIRQLCALGADRARMTAKIAGGAQMFAVQEGSAIGAIGARNVQSVKAALNTARVPLIAEDTGLNYGRTVYFDLGSGIMKVQSLNRTIREL